MAEDSITWVYHSTSLKKSESFDTGTSSLSFTSPMPLESKAAPASCYVIISMWFVPLYGPSCKMSWI